MSATEDPYYLFKDNVQKSLQECDVLLQKWKSLLHAVNTAESSEFKSADAAVKSKLKGVEEGVGMLKGMVQRVVSDRSKFAHIDDSELESRKAFVKTSEDDVSGVRGQLFSAAAKGKQEADERQSLASASAAARDATPTTQYEKAHANVFQSQQQVRRQHEEHQDEHLEAIDNSLSRLGEMAKNIDDELTEQQAMLEDVEEDMDDAHNKMNANLAVIGKMLKTKDRCQIITIVILILVLVGLFIAVMSGI